MILYLKKYDFMKVVIAFFFETLQDSKMILERTLEELLLKLLLIFFKKSSGKP